MGHCVSKPTEKKNDGTSFSKVINKLLFPFKKRQSLPSDSVSASSPNEKQSATIERLPILVDKSFSIKTAERSFANNPLNNTNDNNNIKSSKSNCDDDPKEHIVRVSNNLKPQSTDLSATTPVPSNKFCPYTKNVFIFDKKLTNKVSHLHKISKRDVKLLDERKREKEKRQRVSKEHKLKSAASKAGSSQSGTNNNKDHLNSDAKAQLPIGVRGFVTDFQRPNRFAFRYLPPSEQMSPELKKRKFEILFEKLSELNSNVETLTHSYNNIVKSLMHLQLPSNKRDGLMSTLSITSETTPSPIDTREPIDVTLNKIEVSRFINSDTKHKAFQELNELVEELNVSLDEIHVYYDDLDGTFDFEEYMESEFKISLKVYQSCLKRIELLKAIVQKVLKINSNQLINMFKL